VLDRTEGSSDSYRRQIHIALYFNAYFDGVGERDHDSDWKSLWYRNDKDRNANDDEADKVLDVGVVPRQPVHNELVDAEMQNKRNQIQHCYHDSCLQNAYDAINSLFLFFFYLG